MLFISLETSKGAARRQSLWENAVPDSCEGVLQRASLYFFPYDCAQVKPSRGGLIERIIAKILSLGIRKLV